jgi:O-antigen/teichoic acid export membrane protein
MYNIKSLKGRTIIPIERPSLIINAISNWITVVVGVAVGFFLTPFIINYLGKTGFGIWKLIASIIGYYGLIDVGSSHAITRYIARYAGQKNYKALNETISTAIAIFAVLGLFVLISSFILAEPLAQFFRVPANQIEDFRYAVWVLGLTIAFQFIGSMLGAVIRAHELFVIANAVTIGGNLLRAGLVVFNLSHDMEFIGIAFANLAQMLIMTIIYFILCKILFSYFQPRFDQIRRSAFRALLIYGFMASIMAAVEFLRLELGSMIIGRLISLSALAIYAIPVFLIRYIRVFVISGTERLFIPRFSELEAKRKPKELNQLFLKTLSFSGVLSFCAGTLAITLGKKFIILWLGSDFLEAVGILWILVICFSFSLANSAGVAAMYALNRFRFLAIGGGIEVIFNLTLSILLASHYGIIGVAIGICVPMLITSVLVYPAYIAKILKISLKNYWGRLLPPLILSSGVVTLYRCIPEFRLLGDSYFSLAFSGIPICLAFALLSIILYAVGLRLESSAKMWVTL